MPASLTMNSSTGLHRNPFWMLGVTTRDDRRKIVEAADEKSLHLDHDLCQKARADLTNPRTRLAAEMAWLPGVAPRMAEKLTAALAENPRSPWSSASLPDQARANLMAAAIELIGDSMNATDMVQLIVAFAEVTEAVNADDVLRDINEDRAVSGFPQVGSVELIEEELAERRKAYRAVLKGALDAMLPDKLIQVMTGAAARATRNGESQAPSLIDDLVDTYAIEAQRFLDKEAENIDVLIASAWKMVPHGPPAVTTVLDKLEKVARNWDRVAQPIQLCAKSRGTGHPQSRAVAMSVRNFGIELYNKHGMLDQSHRTNGLLHALFAELPDVAEWLEQDAQAFINVRRQHA